MNATTLAILLHFCTAYGVEPRLAMAVVQTESQWDASTVGDAGEIGLMQLMPNYFNVPREQLFDVRTNLRLGIKHLAKMQRQCKYKDDYTFLVCYNRGLRGGAKVKHPLTDRYVRKVMQNYETL